MIRAVIDTNILVSALITQKTSPPRQLYRAFTTQQFLLITSPSILAEVEDVINRDNIVKYHKLDPKQRKVVIEQLVTLSYIVPESVIHDKTIIERDPEDDKFLYAALYGHADYIVSGDNHLLDLREYERIKILIPKEFLVILKNNRAI